MSSKNSANWQTVKQVQISIQSIQIILWSLKSSLDIGSSLEQYFQKYRSSIDPILKVSIQNRTYKAQQGFQGFQPFQSGTLFSKSGSILLQIPFQSKHLWGKGFRVLGSIGSIGSIFFTYLRLTESGKNLSGGFL